MLDLENGSGEYPAGIVQDLAGNGEQFSRRRIAGELSLGTLPVCFRTERHSNRYADCNRADGAHLEPHNPEGHALTGADGVYFKVSQQFCDGCHIPGVITEQALIVFEEYFLSREVRAAQQE